MLEAPIPRAKARMAIREKRRPFPRLRRAYRKSRARLSRMSFPVGVAHLLLDAFQATEFLLGAAAGFCGAQAGGDVVGDWLLQVEAELFVLAGFRCGICGRGDGASSLLGAPTRRLSGVCQPIVRLITDDQ